MPLATNRLDFLGMFKSATTVVGNSSRTGILFFRNTTASNNWFGDVCNAGTCTHQDTAIAPDAEPHIYCIFPNSTHNNFWIDGTLRAAVIKTNQPTTNISTIGTWVESRQAAAKVQVINWAEFGMLRS
jgi:hypothetical protein